MRRLIVGLVVAAATTLVPMLALAGNQEIAEQIARRLRESGQLQGYKIGVKYQEGTAWLRGRVSSHEQMEWALKLVFQTDGVTRVINDLTIGANEPDAPAATAPNSREPDSSATRQVQPLRLAAGAVAPEQLARPTSASLGSSSQPVGIASGPAARIQSAVADAVGHASKESSSRTPAQADRVATSFMPAPAQRVAATSTQSIPPGQRVAASSSHGSTSATHAPSKTSSVAIVHPNGPSRSVENAQSRAEATTAAGRGVSPIPVQYVPAAYSQSGGVLVAMGGQPIPMAQAGGGPIPQYVTPVGAGMPPVRYDQPHMPNYAWPSYAAYPNYAALTYPKQHSPTAWPYIGPFYPYPQVPLGWRKVTLEWHDGWWNLDFDDGSCKGFFSGLFRPRH